MNSSLLKRSIPFAAIIAICLLTLCRPATARSALQTNTSATPTQDASVSEPGAPITHYTLPPGKNRKAIALAQTGRRIFFAEFIWGTIVLLLLLRLGGAAKFRDWAERVSRRKILQALVFCPALVLTLDLANLPFRIYAHSIVRGYGLSVEDWAPWFFDVTKAEVISLILATFTGWVAITLIRRSPRRWWLAAWAIMVPLTLLGAYAEPFIVEPLFYQFQPLALDHPALANKVEQAAGRAGVPISHDRIFEMLASKKLTETNAYVTGIGGSKRVVFWDTMLKNTSDDEALATFGHELGHYALNHIWQGLALAAISMAIGLPLLAWVFSFALCHWGNAWSVRGPGEWPALAVLLLLVSLAQFATMPAGCAISRHFEHQADVYGLELIHGIVPDAPHVAARTFQILGETNLEEPDPSSLTVFWFYTHPPIADRLDFALHYDPWSTGASPQFIK